MLFALVVSIFSPLLTVKANPDKIVYVVICVDTEFWGEAGHNQYLGSTNPHPIQDVREYARNPPGNVAAVYDSAFRNAYRDSFGNMFKMTWLADMDYLEAQSNFVWADGSSAGVSGYTAIYDLLMNNWGTEISTYGDSIEYHHHFIVYSPTLGWQRYDNGPDAGYPGYQEDALDHMILDRGFYPSAWRSGWWIMPPALSSWLENWIPFDYTNQSGVWYPEHPAGMTRWQTECAYYYPPNVNYYSGASWQEDVNASFTKARDSGSAIYAFSTHDREDMAGQISTLEGYLNTVASDPIFAGVKFKFASAREAMQGALGYEDSTPPTFTITPNAGSYTVTSSEPLWQDHPYVALEYSDGSYHHVAANPAGPNTWTVDIPTQIVEETNVASYARATTGLPVSAVTASNYSSGYEPEYAVDGIDDISSHPYSGFWDSTPGTVPQWLQVDLGSQQTFSNVRTHFWDVLDSRIYSYYIEASNDTSTWTPIVASALEPKQASGVVVDTFSPVNARYVRITVTDNSVNEYAHIIEISVGSAPASVSASSIDGAHTPELAIDGVESTSNYWGTDATVTQLPQWLQVDLRSPISISKITTHFYDGDVRTYTYHIDVSTDGTSWDTVVPTKSGSGSVTDTFAETTARYVKITVTGNTANDAAHIEEIKIYHVTATVPVSLLKIGVGASDLYGNTGTAVLEVGVGRSLTVSSAHDSPSPQNGITYFYDGQSVTCSVTSPVTEGNTVWTCTGWTGTGSVPSSGTDKTVTFAITEDSSITWNWVGAPVQRTLTVVSDHGVSDPAAGEHFYADGSSVTVSISSPVTEGGVTYVCSGWTGTGSVPSSGSGASVTFTISADSSVTWLWTPRFTITVAQGEHGTISPETTSVDFGGSQEFTMTPDAGYHVFDVMVDGESQGALASWTFSDVQADHSITATFEINGYTITPSAGDHGAISPDTPQDVAYGGTPSFTVTPDAGYHILDVKVDGVSVLEDLAGNVYTFDAVSADHNIDATFASDSQFTITVTQSDHGTITPGTSTVDYGATPSFTLTPDAGYHIASITANGEAVTVTSPSGQVYQFSAISADGSLTATYAINVYTVTVTQGTHGTISSANGTSVNYGDSLTFTVTPDTGYHTVDVVVDGVSKGVVASWDFTDVQADHSITASFAIDQFTVTPSADAHGSISPDTVQTVNYGDTPSFTVTADAGYHILDVKVDGSSVLGELVNGVYTFSAVSADHAIDATFEINQYTITPSAIGHGSISPDVVQTVVYGATPSFTVTPETGYHILDVQVDGVSVLRDLVGNTYTFPAVSADHTITATFAIDTFTITVTQGAHGTIAPDTTVVDYGGSQSFAITPDTGYHIVDVLVDGVSKGAVTSWDFTNVQSDHSIAATFAINQYYITVTSAYGNPTASAYVNWGTDFPVSVSSPAEVVVGDHRFICTGFSVDGGALQEGTSYTFTDVQAAHTITFSWTEQFWITVNANGHGSPSEVSQWINAGSSFSVSVTSPEGDASHQWVVVGSDTQTITDVEAAQTLSFTWTEQFWITVDNGGHGSPTEVSQWVNKGASFSTSVTSPTDVVPDVSQWIASQTTLSIADVESAQTLSFVWTEQFYITVDNGGHGTINPGTTVVDYGGSQEFTITADTGYHVVDVVVDGVSKGVQSSWTFSDVQETHTLAATFAINEYTITPIAGANGEISPGTVQTVEYGATPSFTITPALGYHILDVKVDDVSVLEDLAGNVYTFAAVSADHSIDATFAIDQFTITVTQTAHGTIAPGTSTVDYGATPSFTITPDAGYHIASITANGEAVAVTSPSGQTYQFGAVSADGSLTATYAIDQFTITVTSAMVIQQRRLRLIGALISLFPFRVLLKLWLVITSLFALALALMAEIFNKEPVTPLQTSKPLTQ